MKASFCNFSVLYSLSTMFVPHLLLLIISQWRVTVGTKVSAAKEMVQKKAQGLSASVCSPAIDVGHAPNDDLHINH
ncbi:hypothetical protein VNO78_33642 [Psophocarpus tetragonolobus]|uniref:Uncharacterized protein n=1 Tax=Psophocarpus tetragonolobus TaxID=3891 RepID=A0AAN9P2J3_PSOTE